ncbi:Fe-S cluster assembly protein SufD [Verrucomicrobiaceae bacterium N1E253]|uniref:Fe-S cluster assembly protein SufD n=1 Tax=Oceaniferula marina TaxID=2748318 RepID=A0A851GH13_9BACT|nr:Fe-S cluster assembly protein SufD [Oceaniferula marina]NWK55141.1 Fe-S cluster assembly protein SufD [Oceaniferula marina]
MTEQSQITNDPSLIPSEFPDWFKRAQTEALEQYETLPMPTRKDETWRFSNLKQLDFSDFQQAETETIEYTIPELPEGVICLPFEQALAQHGELVQQHFMQRETRLGSAKFAALHKARVKSGLFVYVPDGVVVEKPIEVTHTLSGQNTSIFPHTLIVTGVNAQVSVLDRFVSTNEDDPGLCIAVNDLIAGDGSTLKYCAVQELNLSSRMIQVNATTVGRDANALAFTLNSGAQWARNESLSRMECEGAHSDMLACSIPAGTQQFDQRTYQHHAAAHTNSDLLYKNTLYGNSKTVFSGLIFVDEAAHYTDAYQTCRNLLMEDTVEANSMPGLQINADQVKCSHGSTASSIDDEEIFYLCARGITPRLARRLIAEGFSVEVIERIKNERLEEVVLDAVSRKFASL